MRRRLCALLLVTDVEWRPVAILTAAMGLLIAGAVIGFSAANALFMREAHAAGLPWVYLWTALAMLCGTPLTVGMARRLPHRTQITLTYGLSAALLAGIPAVLGRPWGPWVFLISAAVVHGFCGAIFWTIAAEAHDPRQAKRLFPVIAAGGSLGAVAAGGLVPLLESAVEIERFPWIWAACLSGALLLLAGDGGPSNEAPARDAAPAAPRPFLQDTLDALSAIRRVPIGPTLVFTSGLTVLLSWLINAEFNLAMEAALPSPQAFASRFAQVTAAISLCTLVAQLGGVGRLLSRLGLVESMYVAPAALLGPTVVLALAPGLTSATACRFLEQLLSLALVGPCVDTLSSAVPARDRAPIMALMRTVVAPLAMTAAGLLLLLASSAGPSSCRVVIPFVVATWALSLLHLRQRYLDTLLSNLETSDNEDRISAMGALERLTGQTVDLVLRQSMRSPRVDVAVFALELSAEPGFAHLTDAAVPCLGSPHPEVRAQAMRTLASCAPAQARKAVFDLLEDPDPRVRRAALDAIPDLARPVSEASLRSRFLETAPRLLAQETDAHIVAAWITALANTGLDPAGTCAEIRLRRLRGERLAAALSLAAVPAEHVAEEALALLSDDDPDIADAAARALHGPFDDAVLSALIARLAHDRTADAAIAGLSQATPPDVTALRLAMRSDSGGAVRERLCAILGRVGSPSALEGLIEALTDPAAEVRAAAALALSASHLPLRDLDLTSALLTTAETVAVTAAQRCLLVEADPHRHLLLVDALDRRLTTAKAALDALISLSGWGHGKHGSAPSTLPRDTDERRRWVSLELIESAVPRGARAAVLAVVEAEDAAALTAVEVGEAKRWRSASAAEALDAAARSDDRWLVRCARWARGEEDETVTVMEKLLFLRQVDLFRGMSGRDLAMVAENADERMVARDEMVFEEGAPGDFLFMVTEGSVGVMKGDRLIHILGVRECFGEMALLSSEPRSASIRALEETRLLTISRRDFRALIERHPSVAFPIFEMLSQRLREATNLLQTVPPQA